MNDEGKAALDGSCPGRLTAAIDGCTGLLSGEALPRRVQAARPMAATA